MNTELEPKHKVGILIVGLGGNNGVTLLAGQIAAKNKLSWESSSGAGRVSAPNWGGCITQLPQKGGGVGFRGRFPLADVTNAAIGGWDIRPTPLGDALYESRVVDFDLVRQVREEMNAFPVMKGVYNADFLGESQHSTATHVVDSTTLFGYVEQIRNDIRSFKTEHSVDGHTTVIWSASVERPAEVDFNNGDELLRAILATRAGTDSLDLDVSPSMLYAIAAALEGCSFVNGGSQNTLSDSMSSIFESSFRVELAQSQQYGLNAFLPVSTASAYLLGTDFKAGQTKFKTAVVEYIRSLGLTPRVIASSNHLGNNDMLNLTSKKTVKAKMKVKTDIFAPWEEHDLDHQVRVMYTPMIMDEKRDVVEYTALGFLSSTWTMVTYTRAMDSILCVPLMIDAAIWLDFFARKCAPSARVGRATAYLFKIPEGGAKGVDPGFQRQMRQLEEALQESAASSNSDVVTLGLAKGIITLEQAEALRSLS